MNMIIVSVSAKVELLHSGESNMEVLTIMIIYMIIIIIMINNTNYNGT